MQIKTAFAVMTVGFAVILTLSGPERASADELRGDAEVADADAPSESGAGCSDHTLHGDYAFVIDGTILTAPSPLLLRGVAMTHFDGHGNLNQIDFVTLNGAGGPDWRPATGTYEINPDCTGVAQILPDGAPPLNLRLVVGDRGRQVWTVVIGNPTGSMGSKVR